MSDAAKIFVFKIWSSDHKVKKEIVAASLEDLQRKGAWDCYYIMFTIIIYLQYFNNSGNINVPLHDLLGYPETRPLTFVLKSDDTQIDGQGDQNPFQQSKNHRKEKKYRSRINTIRSI